MRRRYRTEEYKDRVRYIADRMPEAGIGIDVIVGFPGETEKEFDATRDFLLDLPASYLHVFTYSERAKTTALRMSDVVPIPVRKARNKVLQQVSMKMQWAHAAKFEGAVRPVLLESDLDEQGRRSGYTPEYVRVAVADGMDCSAGAVVPVELGRMSEGRVQGRVVSP